MYWNFYNHLYKLFEKLGRWLYLARKKITIKKRKDTTKNNMVNIKKLFNSYKQYNSHLLFKHLLYYQR